MPQNLPALTAQVAGLALTVVELLVLEVFLELVLKGVVPEVEVGFEDVVWEVEVVFEVVWEVEAVFAIVEAVEIELLVVLTGATAPLPGTRYQFASGSFKHSPAVTPFHPLAWMRLK